MKIFILITVMAFITACSVGTPQVVTVEPIEEVQAPVVKTASACSDERSCK
tara:strand:- start:82 stop:234 length:153 start_codon:yes stop_codon:yes gene_type:complete